MTKVMKIGGWKDIKPCRLLRLAGIDEQGAADGLRFYSDEGIMSHVVELFKYRDK